METTSVTGWRLEVLGGARVSRGAEVVWLDGKAAGLAGYLAWEGPTARSRLAGLLWPETAEAKARNNLSQLLRRLRAQVSGELVVGEDVLALAPDVATDAAALRAGEGEAWRAGVLLEGLALDDTEDFAAWLGEAREAAARVQGAQLARELERCEQAGDLAGALELARLGVERAPYSEDVHRRLMRAHYLAGDRAAALLAYERCRTMLAERLGAEPHAATQALARELSEAPAARVATPAARPNLPLTVLRPPVLVGREREWARMEEAWAVGQGIVISGPPGVGKSRLMNDFLQVKAPGRVVHCSGKLGDRAVPYGTHARTYRQLLDKVGGDPLPEWARAELARIIPELGPAAPPFSAPEDRLRFFQAKIEPFKLAHARGYDVLAFDDLQYVDPASTEAGTYVLMALLQDPQTPVRTIHCFRAGELPKETEDIIQGLVAAGVVCHIELEPLAPEAVQRLLTTLEVGGMEEMGPSLAHYTGGNPLFVLEAVRHLLESRAGGGVALERLPPLNKVGPVIAERLGRLSPPAQLLAQALAVLDEDFALDVAGVVLETAALALGETWRELETAQVVRGSGFSHDLMYETVEATTPAPVKQLLHRRAALALEARGAPPARVASHWASAGEPVRAAPHLLRAAELARAELLLQEASAFYERAAEAFRAGGDEVGARAVMAAREQALGPGKVPTARA